MTRRAAWLVVSAALLAGAMLAGLVLGAAKIPVGHALGLVLGGASDGPGWEPIVLFDVRLPRVVAGAFVGAALAVSGATLQGLFRNPLADPGVIGVASGASLGAVTAIHHGLAARSIWMLPGLAIAGAGLTAVAVYAMASRRGQTPVGTLLLAGIAVGSLASALTSLVLSLALDEYEQGRQMFAWLMGGLDARTWDHVALVAPLTLAGSAIILASARELDALLLGETQAASVGVDVPRVRRRLIVATAVVVGAAVAVAGVIGFVGLVVPHILRLLVGPAHAWLLPTCLLFGAAFVVGADALARTLVAPEEIRLGVMTASIGAPFFLFLLLRRRREISLE